MHILVRNNLQHHDNNLPHIAEHVIFDKIVYSNQFFPQFNRNSRAHTTLLYTYFSFPKLNDLSVISKINEWVISDEEINIAKKSVICELSTRILNDDYYKIYSEILKVKFNYIVKKDRYCNQVNHITKSEIRQFINDHYTIKNMAIYDNNWEQIQLFLPKWDNSNTLSEIEFDINWLSIEDRSYTSIHIKYNNRRWYIFSDLLFCMLHFRRRRESSTIYGLYNSNLPFYRDIKGGYIICIDNQYTREIDANYIKNFVNEYIQNSDYMEHMAASILCENSYISEGIVKDFIQNNWLNTLIRISSLINKNLR